jgi:hypothetical protein
MHAFFNILFLTHPFNNGTIEIEIKSCHIGPLKQMVRAKEKSEENFEKIREEYAKKMCEENVRRKCAKKMCEEIHFFEKNDNNQWKM